jgi:hypothetical protein
VKAFEVNPSESEAVLLDKSGSMRYDEQYVNVKRMGLALDGLTRGEYPGDSLQLIERYTFARPRHVSEVAALMDKPVTLFGPWVRKKVNRGDPEVSEVLVPPLFTNARHGLQLARQSLAAQDTLDRQVILISRMPGSPAAAADVGARPSWAKRSRKRRRACWRRASGRTSGAWGPTSRLVAFSPRYGVPPPSGQAHNWPRCRSCRRRGCCPRRRGRRVPSQRLADVTAVAVARPAGRPELRGPCPLWPTAHPSIREYW